MANPPAPANVVFRSPVERLCAEQALVLRAVGIRCEIQRDPEGYTLVVSGEDAPRARLELDDYARENREFSRGDSAIPALSSGWTGTLSYAAAILLVAVFDDRSVLGCNWFRAGMAEVGLIREGQWWRTATALTLHADPGHLLANLVIGGLFGLFAAQLLGSGLAWFCIVLGGMGGNAINACIRPAGHISVGASTAVFAALGLISACAWARNRGGRGWSVGRWTPLVGGVALLGYLGLGGARTDVAAHVAGFGCGLLLGLACSRLKLPARVGAKAQGALAISSLTVLVLAWGLALLNASG